MRIYCHVFELGSEYTITMQAGYRIGGCIFIRSTRKGYNFLHKNRSEVVFKNTRFYSSEFSHKTIPRQLPGAEITIRTPLIKYIEKTGSGVDTLKK